MVRWLLPICSGNFFLLALREQMRAHLLHADQTAETKPEEIPEAMQYRPQQLQGDHTFYFPPLHLLRHPVERVKGAPLPTARVHSYNIGTGERTLSIVHTTSRD